VGGAVKNALIKQSFIYSQFGGQRTVTERVMPNKSFYSNTKKNIELDKKNMVEKVLFNL
jgi:hypothetical protein